MRTPIDRRQRQEIVMIKKIAAVCLLGTALVSAPAMEQAWAQAPRDLAPSSQAAGIPFLTRMESGQWRGSKLVGLNVFGADNQKIGDINEVIIDRQGQAKAIVIGVGGFLGLGEKNVAIPFDRVQWDVGSDRAAGALTSPDVARTATGAQPGQTLSTGGAILSSPPALVSQQAAGQMRDYPERALVQMSRQDLQDAPEFRYASERSASDSESGAGAKPGGSPSR
jgi:sporulation protein YlmC with PRC-barrel domain